jgi:hypothetical protein
VFDKNRQEHAGNRTEQNKPAKLILEIRTILSSLSTLVCCAFPAALVSIGAGAVLASIVTVVPQLV